MFKFVEENGLKSFINQNQGLDLENTGIKIYNLTINSRRIQIYNSTLDYIKSRLIFGIKFFYHQTSNVD